ncbi:MAG: thiosulfate dehydrogenase [quinone] large subunit [Cellvibrionaceae bacterium]|jgi:thiosulfate dehydrogenase [quinone] large subunit
MATYNLKHKFFGREITTEYAGTVVGYVLVGLRVLMGWTLFQGGIVKILDPEWTAAGFLKFAIPEGNPFIGFFGTMAGSPTLDFLVMWGLTLTGLGLMLGALTRWNAFWGAFMMLMFWAASLTGGLGTFLSLEHGWVVDDHIVYALLLFGLGAFGAGRIFGVDGWLEERYPALRENRVYSLLFG